MCRYKNSALWPMFLACAIGSALVILFAAPVHADRQGGPGYKGCGVKPCIVIEYEKSLEMEASDLLDALRLRLAKHDVVARYFTEGETFSAPPGPRLLWVVHLRLLSSETMLVAVDNLGAVSEDDAVREVRREGDTEATAWTMALMIEEIVYPYLEGGEDMPALGAGLAIIEPKVVGGMKKAQPVEEEEYPIVKSVGLGLEGVWILEAGDLILGPRITFEGEFAENIVAAFEISWVAWADFKAGDLVGKMSVLPLDLMFGYIFWKNRIVELSALAGFSVGFAIYKTEFDDRRRRDIMFEPMLEAAVRGAIRIHGPWAIYLSGGAGFPFVRDRLENNGSEIFTQSWVVPKFDVGFLLWI